MMQVFKNIYQVKLYQGFQVKLYQTDFNLGLLKTVERITAVQLFNLTNKNAFLYCRNCELIYIFFFLKYILFLHYIVTYMSLRFLFVPCSEPVTDLLHKLFVKFFVKK